MTSLEQGNGGPTAVPLTGQQYQIDAGRYRTTVTGLRAGLRELLYDDQPLIAGYQADELPPGGAGQLLAPWPNRIDGGRYTFGGVEYQLALTEPDRGNAIHGLTRWTAWTPVRHDASAVLLRSTAHGQHPLGPDLRRRALAVEPMTCPPNAFVTGDDLLILQPGEAVAHIWGVDVF